MGKHSTKSTYTVLKSTSDLTIGREVTLFHPLLGIMHDYRIGVAPYLNKDLMGPREWLVGVIDEAGVLSAMRVSDLIPWTNMEEARLSHHEDYFIVDSSERSHLPASLITFDHHEHLV